MAPAQVVEARDLPPEVRDAVGHIPAPSKPTFSEASKADDFAESEPYASGASSSAPSNLHTNYTWPEKSATSFNFDTGKPVASSATPSDSWLDLLRREAAKALDEGQDNVMDTFTAQFETTLIQAALKTTHGKRIEAALRLGIGRNTITRKIQDLGIDVTKLD